jgi:uncharacterized LabA/DUF88 family protein
VKTPTGEEVRALNENGGMREIRAVLVRLAPNRGSRHHGQRSDWAGQHGSKRVFSSPALDAALAQAGVSKEPQDFWVQLAETGGRWPRQSRWIAYPLPQTAVTTNQPKKRVALLFDGQNMCWALKHITAHRPAAIIRRLLEMPQWQVEVARFYICWDDRIVNSVLPLDTRQEIETMAAMVLPSNPTTQEWERSLTNGSGLVVVERLPKSVLGQVGKPDARRLQPVRTKTDIDLMMATDLTMLRCQRPELDGVVVVTGDCDFEYPLLAWGGKSITVVAGAKSLSRELRLIPGAEVMYLEDIARM